MTTRQGDSWQRFLAALPPELANLHAEPPVDVLPLPDGRQVTVDELREVLHEQTAGQAASAVRALREERRAAGMLAAAWRHTVQRQAQAVLVLLEAGLAVEAQANARVCLEHAVALQRLAQAADQEQLDALLEDVVHHQQRRQHRQLSYLERLDAASGGQHRGLLAAARRQHEAGLVPADKGRPAAGTVKAHFDDVAAGEHWHSVYGRLSENTHAGLSSAAPYLLPALQVDGVVHGKPARVAWAETLAVLCWSSWAADDAMRRFLVDGDDLAARHVPLMARVGLATQ